MRWNLLLSHHVSDSVTATALQEALLGALPRPFKIAVDGWTHRPGEALQLVLEDQLARTSFVLYLVTPSVLGAGWDTLIRTLEDLNRSEESPPTLLVATPNMSVEDLPATFASAKTFDLRAGPSRQHNFEKLVEIIRGDPDAEVAESWDPPLSAATERMASDEIPADDIIDTTAEGSNPLDGPDTAPIVQLQGEAVASYQAGDLEGAKEQFERVYAMSCALLGPSDPNSCMAANNLAMVLAELGEMAQSRELLLEVWRSLQATSDEPNRVKMETLGNLASIAQLTGDLKDSRRHAEAALSVGIQLWGVQDPRLADLFHALGVTAAAQDDPKAARAAHTQALKLREISMGPEHPESATSHDGLGAAAYAQGHLDAAREHLERAFTIRAQSFGPDDPLTLSTREYLARVTLAQEDLPTTHHLLSGLLAAKEDRLGPHHPELADTIDALAAISFRLGKTRESYRLVDRARGLKEQILSPNHPEVAATLYHQARVARAMGDLGATQRHLERAVAILESPDTTEPNDLASVLNDLGLCHLDQGMQEEAETVLKRALKMWETGPEAHRHLAATALHNLAALAYARGDRRSASRLQMRARSLERDETRRQ